MRVLLFILFAIAAVDAGAAARAWFDRETVTLGETVTLNVEVDGVLGNQPDLSLLDRDFRRIGTSSSAQVNLVNGQRRARTLWAVALEPLHDGVIAVPALQFGSDATAPLSLTVLPAPAGASGVPGDDAFLQVEAAPLDPYVQQQVRYTIRLHYAVPLLEGQLDEPQVDGARLQRIGNDLSYQRVIEGRRYQVVERRYALAAERSGTLRLPAPRFRGRSAGGGLFGGGGGVLQARGDELTLDVRPQPPQAATPWLPTPELTLEDESGAWPDQVRVGEPLTLSLRVAATGLLAEQLPELALPPIDGAQVYPDRESSQTVEAAEWFRGERVRKFAIVPTVAGTLTLPTIRIGWWNTDRDQSQQAELPSRTIRVLPAAAGTDLPSPPVEADAVDGPAQPDVGGAESRLWQWATAALALLWLATLGWGWRRRTAPAGGGRERPSGEPAPPRPKAPALAAALAGDDPSAIAMALRAAPPDGPVAGLDAVADRLAEPAQADAVRRFERALYAGDDAAAAIAELRRSLAGGPRWRPAAGGDDRSDTLPPLYR